MVPTIFHWEAFAIPTHNFFVAVGLLVGVYIFYRESGKDNLWDDRLGIVLVGIAIGGVLGERLGGWIQAFSVVGLNEYATALVYGGKSILGGLAGAYVGGVIGKKFSGYPYRTGDMFAPAVALGLAIGRIGCFLTEPLGRPTSLPWGLTVHSPLASGEPACIDCAGAVTVHPSMLYEIVFLLMAYVALRRFQPRITQPGESFVLFLACYSAFRFLIEFTRANETTALGLTHSQIFLLVVSPLFAFRLYTQWRRGSYTQLIHPNQGDI